MVVGELDQVGLRVARCSGLTANSPVPGNRSSAAMIARACAGLTQTGGHRR